MEAPTVQQLTASPKALPTLPKPRPTAPAPSPSCSCSLPLPEATVWGGVGVKRLGDWRAWRGRTRVSARSNTEAKQATGTGSKQGAGGAAEPGLSLGSGALPSPCGRGFGVSTCILRN